MRVSRLFGWNTELMSGPAQSYASRLLVYAAAATIGSVAGSTFTWSSSVWSDANPLTAGPLTALFSLGLAVTVLALARLSTPQVALLAAVVALAMMSMWYLFASRDSSTSALVFLAGWWIGIPAATFVAVLDRRRIIDERSRDHRGGPR